ncbi:MAG: haloacid dehalogenase, partial [Candidatus Cloacimonetes bacterium]|nr:haloacid dehalogenase [Candidatus Cloacimonadota bacterium]
AAGVREMGLDAARTAAVEDALSGVASAVAAGCGLVIGVDRGVGAAELIAAGAHIVVQDLEELVP